MKQVNSPLKTTFSRVCRKHLKPFYLKISTALKSSESKYDFRGAPIFRDISIPSLSLILLLSLFRFFLLYPIWKVLLFHFTSLFNLSFFTSFYDMTSYEFTTPLWNCMVVCRIVFFFIIFTLVYSLNPPFY